MCEEFNAPADCWLFSCTSMPSFFNVFALQPHSKCLIVFNWWAHRYTTSHRALSSPLRQLTSIISSVCHVLFPFHDSSCAKQKWICPYSFSATGKPEPSPSIMNTEECVCECVCVKSDLELSLQCHCNTTAGVTLVHREAQRIFYWINPHVHLAFSSSKLITVK